MIIQFPSGPMANLQYLILNQNAQEAVAIDPAWDASTPIQLAAQHGCKITQIWITHGHFDHVNALSDLYESTRAHSYLYIPNLLDPLPPHSPIEEGQVLEFGEWKFSVMHTPGHSSDSICFVSPNTAVVSEIKGDHTHISQALTSTHSGVLISGDTLFIGACGGVDFPTSNPSQMMQSLQRLSELPPHTLVCPGHDYGKQKVGSILEERQYNPAMKRAMSL